MQLHATMDRQQDARAPRAALAIVVVVLALLGARSIAHQPAQKERYRDERWAGSGPMIAASGASRNQRDKAKAIVKTIALPKVADIPAEKLKPYEQHIRAAARAHEVDAALLRAVISAESAFDATAQSDKGASGLMQLMPATAEQYDVIDLHDPAQNIDAGAQHLRHLLRLFNNDVALALAAYNAGQGTVLKYGRSVPPYPETVAYVPKVLAYYRKYANKRRPCASIKVAFATQRI